MTVASYRDLQAWQVAMELAELAYRTTWSFPKDELFGLSSQIRRAAASVPANIAEGHGRESTKEFLHHLSIALGSLKELEIHLLLSNRVEILQEPQLAAALILCQRIGQMIGRLRQALQRKL